MWSWPVTLGGGMTMEKGFFSGSRIPVKAAVVLPHLVDAGLHLLGFIHLGQFFHHTFDLSYSLNFRPFCHDWGAGPHRPAVRQIAAQLQQNALCALTAKAPWAFRLRANKCPWYHLDSGKPALCGAFAPALSTVGLRRGLLSLQLRCSGTTSPAALGELTPAVLSLGRCPPDTASLPRSLPYFISVLVYPGSIVKRQLSRRIPSFFSREMMRFASPGDVSSGRCPAGIRHLLLGVLGAAPQAEAQRA